MNGRSYLCGLLMRPLILPQDEILLENTKKLLTEYVRNGGDDNVLTLDYCDYYFDGELQEKNGYVLNIQGRACKLERPIEVRQDYRVNIRAVPERLFLVCETPEIFEIQVNGTTIDKTDCGMYRDIAFRMIDLVKYVKKGENVITFLCHYEQPDSLYENLKKAAIFESEKNKITYETEFEAIYLLGDFSVATDGTFEQLERDAVRYRGSFAIDRPVKKVFAANLEQQGYPFFCGEITLAKTFELEDAERVLQFKKFGVNILEVTVNGKKYEHLWGSNSFYVFSSNFLCKFKCRSFTFKDRKMKRRGSVWKYCFWEPVLRKEFRHCFATAESVKMHEKRKKRSKEPDARR